VIGLQHYLVLGAIVFGIGLYVALAKRNTVAVLMGIELMLNAVALTFLAFARFLPVSGQLSSSAPGPLAGHVFVVFLLTVAAAEAAVALGLTVAIYRQRRTIDIEKIDTMRW
jgi:NADH:ubiquinone oxidoreductase subunit K